MNHRLETAVESNFMEEIIYYQGDIESLGETEIARIRLNAELGHADAQYALGLVLARRDGVQYGEWTEAVKWYRAAAEQGYAPAQHEMGVLSSMGCGMERNPSEAAKWYRKAAEQGYSMAQFELAHCYGCGFGVPKDMQESFKWCKLAAEQGNAGVQAQLGTMYMEEGDVDASLEWTRKAAENGDAIGQYNLAKMYVQGRGVAKNEDAANKLLRLSAAQGFRPAMEMFEIEK